MFVTLYHRYRAWEDDYIAIIDAINAGADVTPLTTSYYRRCYAKKLAAMSLAERSQFRDFLWRYRGWRGWGAALAYVAITSVIGMLIWALRPDHLPFWGTVGFVDLMAVAVGFAVLTAWFQPRQLAQQQLRRLGIIVLLTVVGGICGGLAAVIVRGEDVLASVRKDGPVILGAALLVGIAYAGLAAFVSNLRNRELQAQNERLAAVAERERVDKQLSQSRLSLLQAQIEPHFLFNTLGAVREMTEKSAPAASQLVQQLITFLRATLVSFEDATIAIAEEARIAESYLQIMQTRLGNRLRYAVSIPAHLRNERIPSTILLNLVENAVKHGIEPAVGGGRIDIAVREVADELHLEVADTGAGLTGVPGKGVGLDNIRAQLGLAYGKAASLELEANQPSGFIARVVLPRAAVRQNEPLQGELR